MSFSRLFIQFVANSMRYLFVFLIISAHYKSMFRSIQKSVNFDAVPMITGKIYGIVRCVLTNQGSLVLAGLLICNF